MPSLSLELELISHFFFSEEREMVTFLYDMLTKKYDKPNKLAVPSNISNLVKTSTEFRVAKAERHFYNCDYKNCFAETTR